MFTIGLRLPVLVALSSALLAACGGGDDDAAGGGAAAAAAAGFTATCNTNAYVAGSVELPTPAQIAAVAASYAGEEGQYDNSFNFVKSGNATLVVGADGRLTYRGTSYTPSSICIDKVAGAYGRVMYFQANDKGHFDVADQVDATLGQAWGVSPVDGTTVFRDGRK